MPRPPWPLVRAVDPSPDPDLLARFAADRDPAAFEVLVWRHGRMVYATCRRALADHHAAEDAFQATFLILARKAGGVRGSVPAWLHRVARRVAARAAKQARPVARLAADPPAPAVPPPDFALRALLDEEIDRLPDRLRRPVVLCYLDGRTTDEAAGLLGVPRGTVLSRLSAARATLTARLTRRGVTGPAALLAAGGGIEPLAAGMVGRCVGEAVRYVGSGAAGGSAAILAEGVMRTAKLKAVVLAGGLMAATLGVGTGVGVVVAQKAAPTPAAAVKAEPPKAEAKPPLPEPERENDQAAVAALQNALADIDERIGRLGVWAERVDDLKADVRDQMEKLLRLSAAREGVYPTTPDDQEFFRFVTAVKTHVDAVGPRERYDAALVRFYERRRSPGVKPDDSALTELRAEVEARRQQLIDSLESVISKFEAAKNVPPPVRGKARSVAEQMATDPTMTQLVLADEVERFEALVRSRKGLLEVFRKELRKATPAAEEVAVLREVRTQMLRELEVRKLQAQGVTLPEAGRGSDPAAVADKLDQILREVAALRAEGRAAAKK